MRQEFEPVVRVVTVDGVTNVLQAFTIEDMPTAGFIRRVRVADPTATAAAFDAVFHGNSQLNSRFLVYTGEPMAALGTQTVGDAFEADGGEGIYYQIDDPADGTITNDMEFDLALDIAGPTDGVIVEIEVRPAKKERLRGNA
jgi:hypothetical protein